jgi:hypothetical protein
MSTLEVGTIAPISGSNDVTLGGSSKNIKFASGTTVDFSTNTPTTTLSSTMKNTPAFHAFLSSAQTGVSDGVLTKCQFNSEKFDTDNCYDNSSNYRFTPNVAGKYYVYSMISANSLSASNISLYLIQIRKNGSFITQGIVDYRNNANAYVAGQYSALVVDMNGTSDYLEAFAHIDSANNQALQFQGSEQETYFGAYRIVGA